MPKEEAPKKKPADAVDPAKKKTKPEGAAPLASAKKSGLTPAPKAPGGDEPPPKTKTKRVAKDAAAAKPAEPAPEAAPEAEAPPEAPAEGGSKTKTGKKSKGDLAAKAGTGKAKSRAPRPTAPPPAPAVKGPVDYAIAAAGPILGGALGAYGFLLVKQAVDRLASNPLLPYATPDALPAALGLGFATAFPPAPIIAGVVLGLLGTFCAVKMAAGNATRIMAIGVVLFAVLSTAPFIAAGSSLNTKIKQDVGKVYPIPRGGDVDKQALDLKAADYELRHLLALWKVDLDEGEIPVGWLATVKDREPSDDKDKTTPENERGLVSSDLWEALRLCRDLKAKYPKDVEAIQPKLEALRDKVLKEMAEPTEETQKLDERWNIFEGQAKGSLAKPPKPKSAGAWFTSYRTWGELGVGKGTPQADRAFYSKRYVGKAVHKLYPQLPKELRYAGAFQVDVADDFQGKDPAEQTLTKYATVFVAYDLEKIEKVENDGKISVKIPDPVVLPYIKGLLGEARFAIEVLGQK